MLLKICYAPGCSKYITDVKTIDFVSDSADNAELLPNSILSEANNIPPADTNKKVFFCNEYLSRGIGGSFAGKNDTTDGVYLSKVTVNNEHTIYFTGQAYLCDESGKTVDALR